MNYNTKVCRTCKIEKELSTDFFHKASRNKDGLASQCKQCNGTKNVRNNIHIIENKILCLKCKNYKEDIFFDNDLDKPYRKNKDTRCKDCKIEQYNNRRKSTRGVGTIDRIITERYCALRDRAAKSNTEVDFDRNYLMELWNRQKGLCALSGLQMTYVIFSGRVPTNVSVDKIIPEIGYIKGNVQLVCMAVNQMKSDLTENELLHFCRNIINNYESKNN